MNLLIGRIAEIEVLNKLYKEDRSEFVALYGRRRVGKTFLIRNVFERRITFKLTGIANVDTKSQLAQFNMELAEYTGDSLITHSTTWFEAFSMLAKMIEKQSDDEKKVIFLDELPWLSTRGSKFIAALEHFWNHWASGRNDILLIVCGSAASWMITTIINNKGGLHNRVTHVMKLHPFSLAENEVFLKSKGGIYDRYQLVLLYMVFGGIPYYIDKIDVKKSADQNIDKLCFGPHAALRREYDLMYLSLFKKSERHRAVINVLSRKNKGLTREEIIKESNISDGGGLSTLLTELEESGFIRRYRSIGKKMRNSLYQLIDPFSHFHLRYIANSHRDEENNWINSIGTSTYRAWSGYAFEMVCLHHISEIKIALGISGIQSSIYSWNNNKAQIDLVIDRKDRVINLCEMKFSIHSYSITKKYAENLSNKIAQFRGDTKTTKTLMLTMLTTYGLESTKYGGLIQQSLNMDVLFV